MASRRRIVTLTFATLGLGLAGLAASPSNPVGYLARAATGQAELLLGRVDVDVAIADGNFSEAELESLRLVPQVKEWGARTIGLAASHNYETIHPTWSRQIWNVSGCEPLAFRPKRYWFPIVGSLTYIGYFDEAQARGQAARLEADGYDTYVRTAGAYSTLGWFRDPLLPPMLKWSEDRLADTLLHELAHATLWVPGHSGFNEAFANFVGERGALGWLRHHHGDDAPEVGRALERDDDQRRYREMLRGVVRELEEVYGSQVLDDAEKRSRKDRILATLPARAAGAGFHDRARYDALFADPSRWNNARLIQFRTYHRGQEAFAALLDAQGGDLRRFIDELRRVVGNSDDPWEALEQATGIDAGA